MEKSRGSTFLKVTGILMIIGGAVALIVEIVAASSLSFVIALAAAVDVTISGGLLMIAIILSLVGAIIQLIAGIIGVANSGKPEKAGVCIIWGFIVIAVFVVSTILTLIGYPESFSFFNLILGLVLPVLFVTGGFLNKKAN